ncbi:MAG: PQQ-dependent sugar dehydrogenase, partial [candidate division Zixibacteria bacterium]|nr:PQQ-dependent sugar dehydrogenase [candidate division Zixibacteria bacterium]
VRTLLAVLLTLSVVPVIHADTPLTTQLVAFGFNQPVFLCAAPGDTTRLFVVEQRGRIRIIKNGSLLSTPFLDIDAYVRSSGSEQGLLGMAFHPDYAVNGYFYVNYTSEPNGDTRVARFQVSADPDLADDSSQSTLLTLDQPYSNHNAGMLAFSPIDGYLYIGLGDGGSGGDPSNLAQDSTYLLGKMLRIDVDGGSPYAIPPSNPWYGHPTVRNEIWAFGLRNPWRYGFDRLTGDLYIADVGQGEWEEIDFQSMSSSGGENYGWRLKEGTHCYHPSVNCEDGVTLVEPVYEYSHSGGNCSITGGYVYRGCAIPDLQGAYFFADYCSGRVWSFRYDGATVSDFTDRTAEVGQSPWTIASFGEDARGELYIVNHSGAIYKIVPDGVADQCEAIECCVGIRGNVDGSFDDGIDISDLVYLVDFMFNGGPQPSCFEEADVDASGSAPIDIADLVYLVDYMFTGGPAPSSCV